MSKNAFTNVTNEARRARAVETAAKLAPIVKELEAAGVTSLSRIAAALNERGIPTPSGSGRWYHAQVRRLLARMGE
jgi:Recombinase